MSEARLLYDFLKCFTATPILLLTRFSSDLLSLKLHERWQMMWYFAWGWTTQTQHSLYIPKVLFGKMTYGQRVSFCEGCIVIHLLREQHFLNSPKTPTSERWLKIRLLLSLSSAWCSFWADICVEHTLIHSSVIMNLKLWGNQACLCNTVTEWTS